MSNKAVRLVYFSTTILLGLAILFLCAKVDKLEGINNDWSATYQMSCWKYDVALFKLNDEIEQCQKAIESRDVIFEYYKSQPPKIETITEIKEVEVIREVPVELRWFESTAELKTWLGQIDRPIEVKANSEGRVYFRGVCEDIAMFLQAGAEKDGYKMSIEILGESEYFKWYGEQLDDGQLHAINSTIIGNEVWFIDLWNDKVWVGAYLD